MCSLIQPVPRPPPLAHAVLTAPSSLPLSLTLYLHNNGRILSCKNYQTIHFAKFEKVYWKMLSLLAYQVFST